MALVTGDDQSNEAPMTKNTICVWYDKDAEEAANFYAATFPDSRVAGVHLAPSDYPSGKKGQVITVEFTVVGVPCVGLNGGPMFKHTEAFSVQISTQDQEETDRHERRRRLESNHRPRSCDSSRTMLRTINSAFTTAIGALTAVASAWTVISAPAPDF